MELAIATGIAPDVWANADDTTIATVLDILERQADGDRE